MIKRLGLSFSVLSIVAGVALFGSAALADHTPVEVAWEVAECGETTISASVPGGTNIANIYLVVDTAGDTQYANVPADETAVSITVGPFDTASETIYWRVFGGGERDYDDPHWNGYGEPDFGTDIAAYASEVGGYNWVIAGMDDANPFTTWYQFDVDGCVPSPEDKDDCKKGGWESLFRADGSAFKNQGDCVQYVNTGK